MSFHKQSPDKIFQGVYLQTHYFFFIFAIIVKCMNVPVDEELAVDDVELVEGEAVVAEDVVAPEKH